MQSSLFTDSTLSLLCWPLDMPMMLKIPHWHFKWEWKSILNSFQQAQCQMRKKYILFIMSPCKHQHVRCLHLVLKRKSTGKEWFLGFDYPSYSPLLHHFCFPVKKGRCRCEATSSSLLSCRWCWMQCFACEEAARKGWERESQSQRNKVYKGL